MVNTKIEKILDQIRFYQACLSTFIPNFLFALAAARNPSMITMGVITTKPTPNVTAAITIEIKRTKKPIFYC